MSTEQQIPDHVTVVALRAIALAQHHRHEMVTLEHMLAALLECQEVAKCLDDLGIDREGLHQEVTEFLDGDVHERVEHSPSRTREFDVVIGRTIAHAQFSARRVATGLDVLVQLASLPHEDSHAVTMALKFGVEPLRLKRYMAHGVPAGGAQRQSPEQATDSEPTNKQEAIACISTYCTNLNELVKLGKIDPVVGRSAEMERIVQVIARRSKNNAALVGDAGVGKSAIVEGLAHRIVSGDVPKILANSTIWALDIASLVAGTRFRGDFEERMKFLLKSFALVESESPILFIDEMHTIVEAGSGNKGSLDVGNLLKPALARGKLCCIGATTPKDWRQHFEKDRALVRRFKKILVDEPSLDDAKLILRGLRGAYEAFHGVSFTEAALDAAVDLTARYLPDGKLPDKAIDVIDEAGAKQRVNEGARLHVVDVEQVEQEVSRLAKIPVKSIVSDESERLEHLEHDLSAGVFGQPRAISALSDAVLVSRAGLRETNKPEGCFLFTGPTGVGKTEMARRLAETLQLPLVKFDMSEYSEKVAVAKLIGSAPGYVGFGDGAAGDGLLVNAIDKTPACVLLLDEIEKAHGDVFNLLLQVMDDAKLTNSAGKTVSFRSVILIMTSNAGVSATEQSAIGFLPTERATIDERLVRQTFPPEFRNRLDAIIPFDPLDRAALGKVVNKFIKELQSMLSDRDVTLEITDAAKKWLCQHGYDVVYGARPLGRLITDRVKKPLSRLLLFGALKQGGVAKISVEAGNLTVNTLEKSEVV